MIRRLLIDGDAILYRVAAALQQEVWWDDHTRTVTMDVERAVVEVEAEVAKLKDRAKADVVFFFIGPDDKSKNFRKALWPAYKAHRRSSDTPVGLGKLRKQLQYRQDYTTAITPNEVQPFTVVMARDEYEADDTIAEYATDCDTCRTNIVWSPDKDLLQVPGWHMNDTTLFEITTDQADEWHLMQSLIGDVSDGYPGCPGIGPVGAEKIVGSTPYRWWDGAWVWAAVVEAFEKKGLTQQDALVQARVARILRAGERPGEWLPSGGLIRS